MEPHIIFEIQDDILANTGSEHDTNLMIDKKNVFTPKNKIIKII